MQKVKKLIDAGMTLSGAVKGALGDRSLSRVAIERGINSSDLSAALKGNKMASDRIIDAMVEEFGGTPAEWRQLFSDAMQQRAAAVVNQ